MPLDNFYLLWKILKIMWSNKNYSKFKKKKIIYKLRKLSKTKFIELKFISYFSFNFHTNLPLIINVEDRHSFSFSIFPLMLQLTFIDPCFYLIQFCKISSFSLLIFYIRLMILRVLWVRMSLRHFKFDSYISYAYQSIYIYSTTYPKTTLYA